MTNDDDHNLSPTARRLSSAAIVLTLGIVAARCMMSETLRDPFDAAPGADLGARGPGAATTVILNTLSFLPPLLVLLACWLDPSFRLIRSASHLLLVGAALLAVASAAWASDTFAAVITAGNLLSAALLGWTAVQAVRTWTQFRRVTGVAVGLLLVLVAHSILYRTIDAPEMQRLWTEQRETLLRQRHLDPGSFQAQLFERKIASSELIGFSNSPNTLAAVAAVGIVILAGSMLDRRRLRDPVGWLVPALILLGGAGWLLYATGSRTSLATPIVAAGLLAISPLLARWSRPSPGRFFLVSLLVITLGIALVIGHGLYHGNLVERSLTFRWHYWTAAWRMWLEHALAGVGWSNFGLFYSSLKLPFAPEDVKDPHNLVIRFFSELGLAGGILCIAWLLRAAWETTRPTSSPTEFPRLPMVQDPVPVIAPLAMPAMLATLLVILFAVDFSQIPEFYAVETLRRLMYGCILLGGTALVALRSVEHPSLDDRPATWLLTATTIALGIFLLHNTIDFSFFEAGPMALAVVLLGSCIGMRDQQPAAPAARWLIIPLLLLSLAWTGVVAAPTVHAESLAAAADVTLSGGDAYGAARQYEEAFAAAPHLRNADYLARSARALAIAGRPPQVALERIEQALAMNPRLASAWNMKAQLLEAMHRDGADARLKALDLDPANVSMRIALADVLAATGRPAEAKSHYRLALHYNSLLPAEEIRRLPREREQAVRQKLGE